MDGWMLLVVFRQTMSEACQNLCLRVHASFGGSWQGAKVEHMCLQVYTFRAYMSAGKKQPTWEACHILRIR